MYFQYAIIVGLLLLMEIAVIVVAVFFSGQVIDLLKENLSGALAASYVSTFTLDSGTTYTYASSDILSKGIDAVQLKVRNV